MATSSNFSSILNNRAAFARANSLNGQAVATAFGLIVGAPFACLCGWCASAAEDKGELGAETYPLPHWRECSRCLNRGNEPTMVVPLAA